MASQILSGAKNVSYTNNTGQNVRLTINHMSDVTEISWAGTTKRMFIYGPQGLLKVDLSAPDADFGINSTFLPGSVFGKTAPAQAGFRGDGLFPAGFKIYPEDGFGYTRVVAVRTSINSPNYPRGFARGHVINYSTKVFGALYDNLLGAAGSLAPSDPNKAIRPQYAGTYGVARYVSDAISETSSITVSDIDFSIPRVIFLTPGQSFSAKCRAYNIVVIKEDGN